METLCLVLPDAVAQLPSMLLVLGPVHMLEPASLQALEGRAHNHSESHILLPIGSSDAVDDVVAIAARLALAAHVGIITQAQAWSTVFFGSEVCDILNTLLHFEHTVVF